MLRRSQAAFPLHQEVIGPEIGERRLWWATTAVHQGFQSLHFVVVLFVQRDFKSGWERAELPPAFQSEGRDTAEPRSRLISGAATSPTAKMFWCVFEFTQEQGSGQDRWPRELIVESPCRILLQGTCIQRTEKMRKILFWLHLSAGSVAGIVILIMSLTGVLLMYEKQMVLWADTRNLPPVVADKTELLPTETLLSKARDIRNALPSAVLLQSDPSKPVQMTFGREFVYFDPYTGRELGTGSGSGMRQFFRSVTDWHRWLATGSANRTTGRAITGAANLLFLFIVVSGMYLWIPRVWTQASVRAITLFRGGLAGKAREFNWHNVAGIWCCIPLFFVVLGATVISYSWASNLVYTLTGSPVPGAPSEKGREGREGRGSGRTGGQVAATTAPAGPGAPQTPPPLTLPLEGFNSMWSQASGAVSSWQTITLRLPPSERGPVTFIVDGGYAGQPQKRTTLTFDRASGQLRSREAFADLNLGRRVRTWLRFVHTGEYYGIPGQTIAGLASAGGVLLVYTGIALSLRRFFAWRTRKSRQALAQPATAAYDVGTTIE